MLVKMKTVKSEKNVLRIQCGDFKATHQRILCWKLQVVNIELKQFLPRSNLQLIYFTCMSVHEWIFIPTVTRGIRRSVRHVNVRALFISCHRRYHLRAVATIEIGTMQHSKSVYKLTVVKVNLHFSFVVTSHTFILLSTKLWW